MGKEAVRSFIKYFTTLLQSLSYLEHNLGKSDLSSMTYVLFDLFELEADDEAFTRIFKGLCVNIVEGAEVINVRIGASEESTDRFQDRWESSPFAGLGMQFMSIDNYTGVLLK